MFEFLKNRFKQPVKPKRLFDGMLIRSRVVRYHKEHHSQHRETIDVEACQIHYEGGDTVVVAVPLAIDLQRRARFYSVNLDSGAIKDDLGELALTNESGQPVRSS